MKQIKIVFLFCLFFTNGLAKQSIDSLLIRYFSWEDSNQPHIITCTNFEYERPYVDYSISDKAFINDFLNQMKNLQEVEDTDFCVGCKIFFIKDGRVKETACLNSRYLLIKGKTLRCDSNFVQIIDKMMINGTLPDTHKMYLFGKYGDEYIDGRDALFLKLRAYLNKYLPVLIKKRGNIRITVYCKSDKKGKTTMVTPHIHNDKLSNEQKYLIDSLLIRFFKRKVKWKPNETRMTSDLITIMYKYTSEED